MTTNLEIPEFATPCSWHGYATCEEPITGEEFDGECSSIEGMQRCECCGQAAYPVDVELSRRLLATDHKLLGIKHVCHECQMAVRRENRKRPKGCAAFYGSGPMAIPSWNSALRKAMAEVQGNWVLQGKTWVIQKKRKVPTKRKADFCPVGGMHPRLAMYLNGVESGKLPAPWSSCEIKYPEGREHAKNCRCAECAQLVRGKPSKQLLEIARAVELAQHECGLKMNRRREERREQQARDRELCVATCAELQAKREPQPEAA